MVKSMYIHANTYPCNIINYRCIVECRLKKKGGWEILEYFLRSFSPAILPVRETKNGTY